MNHICHHLTRWAAAQCAVITSDSLPYLRLQVWWMQCTIKIFSHEIFLFHMWHSHQVSVFLLVRIMKKCHHIYWVKKAVGCQGNNCWFWPFSHVYIMSCIPYALYLCIILIDFHHIDDPSLLHFFFFCFFNLLTVFWLWHKFTAAKLEEEK